MPAWERELLVTGIREELELDDGESDGSLSKGDPFSVVPKELKEALSG